MSRPLMTCMLLTALRPSAISISFFFFFFSVETVNVINEKSLHIGMSRVSQFHSHSLLHCTCHYFFPDFFFAFFACASAAATPQRLSTSSCRESMNFFLCARRVLIKFFCLRNCFLMARRGGILLFVSLAAFVMAVLRMGANLLKRLRFATRFRARRRFFMRPVPVLVLRLAFVHQLYLRILELGYPHAAHRFLRL